MEDDDNSHSSEQANDNGDQHPIVQQFPRTSKRKQSQSQSQSPLFWYDIRNFPDSLLIEILARLPLKSIFRFKSVCKDWKTLISHPSFSRFYFSILDSNTNAAASSSSSLPFRILYRYIYVSNCKELIRRLQSEISSPSEFSLLLLSRIDEERQLSIPFNVLATSNGLILCISLLSTPFAYYICDPVTQQCITLPKSKSRAPNQVFFCEAFITRVNQQHMLTGYTVVRLVILDSTSSYLDIDMFSSESPEWVGYKLKLPCDVPVELRERGDGPILCYGAFHWLTRNHGIVAFDPYKDPKSVRLIPLPNDRDLGCENNHGWIYRLCDECQGTLRYFEVARGPTKLYFLKMWAINDYEKGEWCCEFKVSSSDLHSSDLELSKWLLKGSFLPLSFHPLNPNVVYLRCFELGWVVSYDVVNRSLDVACKSSGVVKYLSWRVVTPFVLPRWPMLVHGHPRVSYSRVGDLAAD